MKEMQNSKKFAKESVLLILPLFNVCWMFN